MTSVSWAMPTVGEVNNLERVRKSESKRRSVQQEILLVTSDS